MVLVVTVSFNPWPVGVLVVTLEQVAAGEPCFEKVLTDQL